MSVRDGSSVGPRSGSAAGRARAVLEVVLVLAVAHTVMRFVLKRTAFGQEELASGISFSPGIVFAVAGMLALLARGRTPASAGITARGAALGARDGLIALPFVLVAGGILLAFGAEVRPRHLDLADGVLLLAGGLAASAATLLLLARGGRGLAGVPLRTWPIALAVLLASGALASILRGRGPGDEAAALAARLICAGVGEEIFFRGYAQSRLDAAFGTPWQLAGTRFGPGLVGASLLFGVVHVLNPFDTFTGEGRLAWGHGLAAAGMPYGFLRARSGSIAAPAVLHGTLDAIGHWIGTSR